MPRADVTAHLTYQFIRHGADYGSQAVQGSSLYSELDPCTLGSGSRDDIMKYFLHDGAYQWFHIIDIGASWNVPLMPVPVTLKADIGYVYSYFTVLDDSSKANTNTSYDYKISDSSEYPVSQGIIISGGIRLAL